MLLKKRSTWEFRRATINLNISLAHRQLLAATDPGSSRKQHYLVYNAFKRGSDTQARHITVYLSFFNDAAVGTTRRCG